MAATDLYGLGSSGIPPELAAEMLGIKGRRAISQAMFEQSMQPLQAPEVKGRFSVPVSPLQGIAKVMQAYIGSKGLTEADQGMAGVGQKYQQGKQAAFAEAEKIGTGTPAVEPFTGAAAGQGAVLPQPAVPGDKRKQIEFMLTNRLLQNEPRTAFAAKELLDDKTRKIISGEDEIFQEKQPDNTWKEVGRGPRFAKQVAPSFTNEVPVTPVNIQDPNDPNKTIVVDGRSGRVIGKGPKLTEAGKFEIKRQFNMQGIGQTIQDAEDLLTGKGGKSLPTGSGIGTVYDKVSGWVGASPEGAAEAQTLRSVGGALTAKMPRMEGPQSDKDTQVYKEMAAVVGDSTIPRERRIAALEQVKNLWAKYERLNPNAFEKEHPTTPAGASPAASGLSAEGSAAYDKYRKK